MAAADSAPRPTGAAEVELHTADGAAEPEVRMGIFAVTIQCCGWDHFTWGIVENVGCLSFIFGCPVIKV